MNAPKWSEIGRFSEIGTSQVCACRTDVFRRPFVHRVLHSPLGNQPQLPPLGIGFRVQGTLFNRSIGTSTVVQWLVRGWKRPSSDARLETEMEIA